MVRRDTHRAVAPLAALLAAVAACAPPPPGRPTRAAVADDLRDFLPEPGEALTGIPGGDWAPLHARLLAGEEPRAIEAEVERLGPREPAGAARVLRAEARLVAGRGAEAFVELEGLPVEARARPQVRLLEARAREAAGDLVEAYAILRELAAASAAAAARAPGLEQRAVTTVSERIAVALRRGRADEARRDLERLTEWRPHDPATWRAAAAVALARGDGAAELAALRALDAASPLEPDSALRLAELELEVGEAEAALRRLEALAAARPGDARVGVALDRARFQWRLGHAPESVQAAARRNPLTRAELARLLYWLVPEIRAGRGAVGKIASDVVGHEAQDEVVRVVNMGLMRVDENLHRFEPDRAVRRGEALEAVFRAASASSAPPSCSRLVPAGAWTREALCAAAAGCGLTASPSDCLPGGALSGQEALAWIHGALAAGEDEP
jgi:tetratricopeptide (TPR) repeat protein